MEFTRIGRLGRDCRDKVRSFPVVDRRPLKEGFEYIPVSKLVEKPTKNWDGAPIPGIILEEFVYIELEKLGIVKLCIVPKDDPELPGALNLPGQTVARALEGKRWRPVRIFVHRQYRHSDSEFGVPYRFADEVVIYE